MVQRPLHGQQLLSVSCYMDMLELDGYFGVKTYWFIGLARRVEHTKYFLCMYICAYLQAFIIHFSYTVYFFPPFLYLVEENYHSFTGEEGGWNRKGN